SKEVYLHDDLFRELKFERGAYKLIAQCFSYAKGSYEVIFRDVVGFEMTSCDFWGPSLRISCFYSVDVEQQTLIPKLQKENEKYVTPDNALIDNRHYIEVELELISGDCLRVACKTVQFEYNK
ncbi:MAG: hypothetical protein IIY70_02325, partial [Oscillospiraceae bacterium]|nr:hypothetical protein [Oscillospiraceae bacterium]